MPPKKKRAHPQLCMSPSRRMILQSKDIRGRDIPPRVKCLASTYSTPSASTSQLCDCNEEYCMPEACGQPDPPVQVCGAPRGPIVDGKPRICKQFDREMLNATACCQEKLRKLAEESLASNELEKRCSIQEPVDAMSCYTPCCGGNKPLPKTASCLSKSYCPTPIPQKQSTATCPGCPDTQEKDKTIDAACSMESCTRDTPSKTNDHCPEKCEESDDDTEIQSSICCNQQLRAMPPATPIPSRTGSVTIANKSSQVLLAKLNNKNDKKDKKGKKDDKKNKNQKKEENEACCDHEKCVANQSCPCRFPPAFKQYYKCTGKMSGNCTCDDK